MLKISCQISIISDLLTSLLNPPISKIRKNPPFEENIQSKSNIYIARSSNLTLKLHPAPFSTPLQQKLPVLVVQCCCNIFSILLQLNMDNPKINAIYIMRGKMEGLNCLLIAMYVGCLLGMVGFHRCQLNSPINKSSIFYLITN